MQAFLARILLSVALVVGSFYLHASGQGQTTGDSGVLTGMGDSRAWSVPFDDQTVRTVCVQSSTFDPVIILRNSAGEEIRRYQGTRGPTPLQVKLVGNPGASGWVRVIVTGNGPGRFSIELHERPNVATPAPTPNPPTPNPPAPNPPAAANNTIRLEWHSLVDLDLWVTEPRTGRTIYYSNRSGAGMLDHDNTRGGSNASEQYSVPATNVGDYIVQVKFYADHRPAGQRNLPVTARLIVNRGRGEEVFGIPPLHRPGDASSPMPITMPVR